MLKCFIPVECLHQQQHTYVHCITQYSKIQLYNVKPRLHQRNIARNMLLEGTCCAQRATCCLLPSTKLLRGRATCCGQHTTCCRQQATCCLQHIARPRNLLPRNMLRWCKRGLRVMGVAGVFSEPALGMFEVLGIRFQGAAIFSNSVT